MFDKKIKALEARKKQREIDLQLVHDTPSEPMIAEMYKSDILIEIMHIENEIEFEKVLKPFRYAILGFIVLSSALLMYAIIKKYM